MITRIPGPAFLCLLCFGTSSGSADWPTARGDGGRTGTTASGPSGPLFPGWTLTTPMPRPAWPGEARGSLWQKLEKSLTPRAADDLAPVPILVQDLVLFATTHDG